MGRSTRRKPKASESRDIGAAGFCAGAGTDAGAVSFAGAATATRGGAAAGTGTGEATAGAEWLALIRAATRGNRPAAAKATTQRKQASFSAKVMGSASKARSQSSKIV